MSPPGICRHGRVRALVAEAHERFKLNNEGKNSKSIRRWPGCRATVRRLRGRHQRQRLRGRRRRYEFSIMSVSKPFVFALVCPGAGRRGGREKIGVNATGCRSTRWAIEQSGGRPDQPDGELRRNRDDEPGAGRDAEAGGGSSTTALTVRRPDAVAQRGGVRLRVGRPTRNQGIARLLQATSRIYWTRRRRPTCTRSSAR